MDWGAQALAEPSPLEEPVPAKGGQCEGTHKPIFTSTTKRHSYFQPLPSDFFWCHLLGFRVSSGFRLHRLPASAECRVQPLELWGKPVGHCWVGNMHLRGSAPSLLLPLLLLPLGRVLEVGAAERSSMQEALAALDLPMKEDKEPQLQRNHTAVLISSLLRAVHCAEQMATSQDACEEVKAVEQCGPLGLTLSPACFCFSPANSCHLFKEVCWGQECA